MPEGSTLAVFATAAAALLVVPGPAVVYILTRSIQQGRAAGLVSMLGIQVGGLAHVAAAAAGLSAILLRSRVAFTAVKFAGAAYLVALGIRALLGRDDGPEPTGAGGRASLVRLFARGVVVNLLNPKTALFFFAFLPQFVDPARGSVAVQTLVLGLLFIGMAVVTDGAYALVAARLGGWLQARRHFARGRRAFSGIVYVSLGVLAALTNTRTPRD